MKKTIFAIAVAVIAMTVGFYQFGYKRGVDQTLRNSYDATQSNWCVGKWKGKVIVHQDQTLGCQLPDGTVTRFRSVNTHFFYIPFWGELKWTTQI